MKETIYNVSDSTREGNIAGHLIEVYREFNEEVSDLIFEIIFTKPTLGRLLSRVPTRLPWRKTCDISMLNQIVHCKNRRQPSASGKRKNEKKQKNNPRIHLLPKRNHQQR